MFDCGGGLLEEDVGEGWGGLGRRLGGGGGDGGVGDGEVEERGVGGEEEGEGGEVCRAEVGVRVVVTGEAGREGEGAVAGDVEGDLEEVWIEGRLVG